MDAKYKCLPWTNHGESIVNDTVPSDVDMSNDFHNDHNMHGLLNDLFRDNSDQENSGSSSHPVANTDPNLEAFGSSSQPTPNTGPNPEAAKFYQLIKDANVPLYPGCDNFGKLEFIVQLYQIKCLYGWSDKSVSVLLTLLKKSYPAGVTLPESFYHTKKLINELGLKYEKIDACPNDCMLY